MKKIYFFFFTLLLLAGCGDDYTFNENFSVPDTFSNPEAVKLDLASSEPVVFSWSGGGADEGGILLYEVMFDKAEGDFSKPLYSVPSDLGALTQLSLSHVELNEIAKAAGFKISQTGEFKWTVKASRGGVEKMADGSGKITLTRPDEEIPESLYLMGPGTENKGEEPVRFRRVSAGIFTLYTKVRVGEGLLFINDLENPENYTMNQSGTIVMDDEMFTLANTSPVRISVNFNTKQVTIEEISAIRMIWGVNFETIANLTYTGEGKFKAENVTVNFVQPGDPEWLTWTEDRYYFITTINGAEVCWGRMDGVSAENPTGDEPLSFYEVGEFAWDQWEHLWKFNLNMDGKTCTVTIDTDLENMMVHQFTDIR